jgi:hypothetical protein
MTPKRTRPIAGSSRLPSTHSPNMLKSRWSKPVCRKPAVRIRHQSPASTAGRDTAPSDRIDEPSPPLPLALPPLRSVPSAIATLMPIRM